jgi:hypothetical protein
VNEPSSADLVDSLSTLAIEVTLVAAFLGCLGAICTSFKIKWNQRASHKGALDAAPSRKLAARFEIAANVCQYAAIAAAIAGGLIAFARLGHDRSLRAQAKEDKAHLEEGLDATARAASSASALAEEDRRARLQRKLSESDVEKMAETLDDFPFSTRDTRIEVISSDRDAEAYWFARSVKGMLVRHAGWKVVASCGALSNVANMVVEIEPKLYKLATNPDPRVEVPVEKRGAQTAGRRVPSADSGGLGIGP